MTQAPTDGTVTMLSWQTLEKLRKRTAAMRRLLARDTTPTDCTAGRMIAEARRELAAAESGLFEAFMIRAMFEDD